MREAVFAAYDPVLDALGDATRRRILERLLRGPAAVGELAAELPVSRPAVSQHLRVLEAVGLVTFRRDGTRSVYVADPHGLAPLRAWLDRFWEDALERYADFVADQARGGR